MRYVCPICGYVYDEAKGPPWNTLPDDWKCPLCGAARADFRPEGAQQAAPAAPVPATFEDVRPLTAMELSAVCSNLARGCEKQYKTDQAAAFTRLADWLRGRAEPIADPTFDALLRKIEQDLSEGYPTANAVCGRIGDRGALRSLVWSEKVTRMLQSLLARYMREGEAMLRDTGVWVCTICGFVYVGETPPELCPVCKVPGRKLEKIGG
ncbi:MAG: rubredoxin [Clostridia bacterium]|nr:rubredoxin [Clostridia bacterium]MBQ6375304.1 rubredoxin [Clostridia bacterium]